jgi:hypothetical protein
MALKHFQDDEGTEWRVWDVVPQRLRGGQERRATERRRGGVMAYSGPERRTGRDRRVMGAGGTAPAYASGWLCFESPTEKRRLSPIPVGWDDAGEEDLRWLVSRARDVPKRLDCEAPTA